MCAVLTRAAAVLAVLAISGCATLSERDCRSGDWADIGRTDGTRGLPLRELEAHRKACARHGVTPDEAAYRRGRAEGLETYCRPAGGYVAGRSGEAYEDVCPEAAEREFLRAYRDGREIHRLLLDVQELRRRIDEYQIAAMSGEYSPEDVTALRFRAGDLAGALRLREWELQSRDRRYAARRGAPELSLHELR
jgi:hypothetical protein